MLSALRLRKKRLPSNASAKLSLHDFSTEYQRAVTDVASFWTADMQRQVAKHCQGWAPGRFDFIDYLRLSAIRYFHAYDSLVEGDPISVCDVGGFWGAFPITLARLGHSVTMTESLKYYSESFDELFAFIRKSGVRVVDYDPFDGASPLGATFDAVSLMAVLEHYPHSLATLARNVRQLLKPGARLYVEVPNIAFWPKRVGLLLGKSPLAPFSEIYDSAVPFIGHHHEFTRSELTDFGRVSGLVVREERSFNYSVLRKHAILGNLRRPLQWAIYRARKDCREVLSTTFVRGDGEPAEGRASR